jgi:hypothetical protein
MSEATATPVLDGLSELVREIFVRRTITLVVDRNGTSRAVVSDLRESAWIAIQVFIHEVGDLDGLERELAGRIAHLSRRRVNWWARRFREEMHIEPPVTQRLLARAVVYLVVRLRSEQAIRVADRRRAPAFQGLRDSA